MDTLCKIRDIYRSIAEYETGFEKQFGICLNEGMLLCSLSKAAKLSSGEIAELLGITPSNASKVILSVEKKKLIKRMLGNEDKRQMYFSLTAEGKKCLDSIKQNPPEIPELLKCIFDK